MAEKTTFIATGDAFMTRRLPKGGYPGFAEIQNIINKHDVKLSNTRNPLIANNYEVLPYLVQHSAPLGKKLHTKNKIKPYRFHHIKIYYI